MNRALAFGTPVFLTLLTAFLCADQAQDSPLSFVISDVHPLRREPLGPSDRAEGESALRNLRYQWNRLNGLRIGGFVDGRDALLMRLWVRGYPGLAEAWARRALAEDGVDPSSQIWAIHVFGQLAAAGYPGAEEFLACLCDDSSFQGLAVDALVESGAHARYGRLLRRLEREGISEALEALSYFEEELPMGSPARFVFRVQALRDGTWSDVARRLILESDGPHVDEHYLWALRIARARRPPWLEEVLRERVAKRRPVSGWIKLEDDGYDLALLTLAEIGGALDANKRADLRARGYGCEPRARLAEVLREKGY